MGDDHQAHGGRGYRVVPHLDDRSAIGTPRASRCPDFQQLTHGIALAQGRCVAESRIVPRKRRVVYRYDAVSQVEIPQAPGIFARIISYFTAVGSSIAKPSARPIEPQKPTT